MENIKEATNKSKKELKAVIKYDNRNPVLSDIMIISKPSLRVYSPSKKLSEIAKRGKRRIIVSTSQGVMTSIEAQKKGLGGEILFAIW